METKSSRQIRGLSAAIVFVWNNPGSCFSGGKIEEENLVAAYSGLAAARRVSSSYLLQFDSSDGRCEMDDEPGQVKRSTCHPASQTVRVVVIVTSALIGDKFESTKTFTSICIDRVSEAFNRSAVIFSCYSKAIVGTYLARQTSCSSLTRAVHPEPQVSLPLFCQTVSYLDRTLLTLIGEPEIQLSPQLAVPPASNVQEVATALRRRGLPPK
jgi:hypothetical protein